MDFINKITTKGWITIAIIIVVIILIIVWLKNRNTSTITTTTTTPINSANAVTNATSPMKDDSFPISYGSRGPNVSKWQEHLNSLGAKLTADGVWGPLTEAASISKSGFNSITEVYFKSVVK